MPPLRKTFSVLLFPLLLFLGICVSANADARYALVIGNADYTSVTPLRNPVSDATAMATELRNLGFQVTLLSNARLAQMDNAVVRFGDQLQNSSDSVGFFYYAGHGVQAGGQNYLIPVDAGIPSQAFLAERSLPLQSVLSTLSQAKDRLNIIVLDACRDNPFSWSRRLTRGLTVVGAQPRNSIIAYAAGAGQVALDGTGSHGIYTGELLKYLGRPGLNIFDVFEDTGAAVSAMTDSAQDPAIYSQFYGKFYLAARTPMVGVAARTAQQPHQTVPPGMVLVQGGTFTMRDTFGGGAKNEKPLHQVTLSSFYIAKTEVTQAEFRAVTGFNPSDFKGTDLPEDSVTWYDAVTWCNAKSRIEGLQPVYRILNIQKNGDHIVFAHVTVDWSADGYRLPTEAEWEYAAKGGDKSRGYEYAGSNDLAAVAWEDDTSPEARTHPVAQKQPNELELYDMSGNVWEWCWDWYGTYSSASATNPHGPSRGRWRVIRGGSWFANIKDARSSHRGYYGPNASFNVGFRPVRSIP